MPYELSIYCPKLIDKFAGWVKKYQGDPLHEDAFKRAYRVNKLLKKIIQVEDSSVIPSDSVIREFIGGSSLKYN